MVNMNLITIFVYTMEKFQTDHDLHHAFSHLSNSTRLFEVGYNLWIQTFYGTLITKLKSIMTHISETITCLV